MKNNSINLGFTTEQWQKHIKEAYEFSAKAKSEISSLLKDDISSVINKIFSPDSLVVKNLKPTGATP